MSLCDPEKSGIDYLLEFDFVEAITCTYANSASLAIVGLIVFTAVGGSIYIRTGSLIIPFGILLLAGGAVLSQMAAVATPVAVLLLLIVPAGVIAYAYYRFSF